MASKEYYRRKANFLLEMLMQVRNQRDWEILRMNYQRAYRLYRLKKSSDKPYLRNDKLFRIGTWSGLS